MIILSSELKKNHIEQIKLKTLYASKNDTLKELKEKILRCYKNILGKDLQQNQTMKIKDLKLLQMFNGKGNGKRLLVNMIYHYKISARKFRIPGKFLENDEISLEVTKKYFC